MLKEHASPNIITKEQSFEMLVQIFADYFFNNGVWMASYVASEGK